MNFTEAIISAFAFVFGGVQSMETGKITVNMDNLTNKGPVVVALFDSDEGFPKEIDKAEKVVTIKDYEDSVSHTFNSLPFGDYAIVIFQDENSNGKLDSNFIGIPNEPVGASNMTGLGKPSFEKCKFKLKREETKFDMIFFKD